MWRHLTNSSPSDVQDPSGNPSLNGAQDVYCLNVRHRWMCSGHHPCSLIASSHFMPRCGTMIPSRGSPRSPIVGPPPFGDSSPQTALADGDWIPDVLPRCCKSRLSSVFSTQSFTVACGTEVVGVPTPGGGFVQQMSTCTRCGGLTFSLVVCPCWSVLF